MTHHDYLREWQGGLANAVTSYWRARAERDERDRFAKEDRRRRHHPAGKNGRPFAAFDGLIRDLLLASGIADCLVYHRHATGSTTDVHATNDRDLLAVVNGHVLLFAEFRSQVGSVAENLADRTGEALHRATDLWTAYREGAFKGSQRPWLGYFMMLEDAPESTRPIRHIPEPHFTVFPEFRGTSYAQRYGLLCQRLVRERLYDAACFLMSSREGGLRGEYREPNTELSFRTFASGLVGHAMTFARLRGLGNR